MVEGKQYEVDCVIYGTGFDTTGFLGASRDHGVLVSRGFPPWLTIPSARYLALGGRDGLVALDVVGLPVMRTWFIVNLAKKRLVPSAAALRQFMIDEGHTFLPLFPAISEAPVRKRASRSPRIQRVRTPRARG